MVSRSQGTSKRATASAGNLPEHPGASGRAHQQITLPSGRTVGTVESCGELWRAVQLKCFADMMVVDVDETRVSVNI